jgi:hypothetical protein
VRKASFENSKKLHFFILVFQVLTVERRFWKDVLQAEHKVSFRVHNSVLLEVTVFVCFHNLLVQTKLAMRMNSGNAPSKQSAGRLLCV